MDEIERLKDEIEYLAGEEELHLSLRDTFKKYSGDYNNHQKLFGYYFRSRIRAIRELEDRQKARYLR